MYFQDNASSLRLDVVNYELAEDSDAEERNWLVLRCTWVDEEGTIRKDSNSCLTTWELRELSAGLKVLRAGLKESYHSDFTESFFQVDAWPEGEAFRLDVSFVLPNTMDGDDTAEITCTMDQKEMEALIGELDRLCEKFPDRT